MLAAATGGVKEVDIGSLQIQELEGYWEARLAYIELEIKAVFHRCPETRSRDAEQVGAVPATRTNQNQPFLAPFPVGNGTEQSSG